MRLTSTMAEAASRSIIICAPRRPTSTLPGTVPAATSSPTTPVIRVSWRCVTIFPFNKKSVLERVPWATFTDPEVAYVGLTEEQAKERLGDNIQAANWPMDQTDRWITEGDSPGFLKVGHLSNGKLLGLTIVAPRAGEMIQEWVLALDQGLKLVHMAESIHIYPTYSLASQQLASKLRVEQLLSGAMGKFVRKYARMVG